DAAQRRTHHRANLVPILFREVNAGVLERHPGRCHTEHRVAIEPTGPPLLDVIGGMEVINLSGDSRLEWCCIEAGDFTHRRAAALQAVPHGVHSNADGSDGTDSSNDDPSLIFHVTSCLRHLITALPPFPSRLVPRDGLFPPAFATQCRAQTPAR